MNKFLTDRIPSGWNDRIFNGSAKGYVYIVKCNGLYKIGSCKNYHKRFSSIKIKENANIELIRLYECECRLLMERAIQRLLKPYKANKGKDREWFDIPPEVLLPN